MSFSSRTPISPSGHHAGALLLGCVVCLLTACGDPLEHTFESGTDGGELGDDAESTTGEDFIIDNPSGGDWSASGTTGAATGTGGDDGGESGDGGDQDSDDDGGDVLSEADIIALEGDRLYAMSVHGGLSVLDISNPADMRVLGHHAIDAYPFEMYVDGDQVFAMYTNAGFRVWDDDQQTWNWQESSRLLALDASDPSNIAVRGEYRLPGYIQDSRRVDDVLYLVTLEDGWCWQCDQNSNTRVVSFDIADPSQPKLVDQLRFVDEDGWAWRRSVSATPDRMYVAGWSWDETGSNIDVIDISDDSGLLVPGASVTAHGSIQSRWQMNEYDQHLRVVSQRGSGEQPPVIETFEILSSSEIVAKGSLEMTLPRPEMLRSARFDGPRGYAVTFERTDPLFTIDLSEPATPRQVGELEIPGWVHHIEPRGDRLLGLGFDQNHPEGAINVSLFDVSDFEAPKMLSRVHFGEDWAQFAEDQDRLHKAFTILEDEELLLIPYSGWTGWGDGGCWGRSQSGVQLVDWRDDMLAGRGVASTRGRARRALMHRDQVVTVSDHAVQSFDIANRDRPEPLDDRAIAMQVDAISVGPVWTARLSHRWWSGSPTIEIVASDAVGEYDAHTRIDLGALLELDCQSWSETFDMFWADTRLNLLVSRYGSEQRSELLSFDPIGPGGAYELSDRRTISLMGGPVASRIGGVDLNAPRVLQVGQRLAITGVSAFSWDSEGQQRRFIPEIYVADLRGRDDHRFVLPESLYLGGFELSDGVVSTWHAEAVSASGDRMRVFLDRFDFRGETPGHSSSVNVPGVPFAYDHQRGRAWTLHAEQTPRQISADACRSLLEPAFFDSDTQTCIVTEKIFNRVDVAASTAAVHDRVDHPALNAVQQLNVGEARIFGQSNRYGNASQDASIVVIAEGLDDGVVIQELKRKGWLQTLGVSGTRALVGYGYGEHELLDASIIGALKVKSVDSVGSWSCYAPTFTDDRVYCPLGLSGLVELPF